MLPPTFNRLVTAALAAGLLCVGTLRGAALRGGMHARASVASEAQQPDPKKKELSISVLRSVENETITVDAYFPEDAKSVRVALYNILGKLVEQLPVTAVSKGNQVFRFQTYNLASGPYLVVLEANNQRVVNKVMISR
ncbi:MAG TPA: T9SS type A sorting domain-containing protein [Candidatus Kapabacteria bacterium]|nr:T9SS type A sorting domain-containing protein [Candidatus Kapabacteria bacterium]